MSIILITKICEKKIFRVSHAPLLERLRKTMECTPERVRKVTVTENKISKPTIQHEKQ